jgi:dihydropteroate synthase
VKDGSSPAAPQLQREQRLERLWPRRRPVVMAVVNCTPDSFSDGGRFLEPDTALRHAESLLEDGADIVDVGGESTRPGAHRVSAEEELRRILPVISELRRRRPEAVISADTRKRTVAIAALEAGADVVNDVTAGDDDGMFEAVAEAGAAMVLMHMRGEPQTMQANTHYDDVVAEVFEYLRGRAAAAVGAGIPPGSVWLDPGIGFGKDAAGNLTLLAAIPRLAELGHPVLVGPSRKSFIGQLTGAPIVERLPGTLAALAPAVGLERVVVRVHDPAAVVQYLEMSIMLREAAS